MGFLREGIDDKINNMHTMPNGADKKLQQFRKFALPFYITKEQVKVQENIKGTP